MVTQGCSSLTTTSEDKISKAFNTAVCLTNCWSSDERSLLTSTKKIHYLKCWRVRGTTGERFCCARHQIRWKACADDQDPMERSRTLLTALVLSAAFFLAIAEDQCNSTGPRKDCGACFSRVYGYFEWLLRLQSEAIPRILTLSIPSIHF